MKQFLIAILLFALITQTAPVRSQQPAADKRDQDEVVRIDTTLVQLHAVVTDSKGRVITNLNQDDFEVFENGVVQEIKSFSLEQIQGRQPAAAPANNTTTPAATPSPMPPAGPRKPPRRTVVLFVDTLHLTTSSLMRSKQQLRQFIDEQLTDEDLVGVVEPTGALGVLQQFMQDRKRLKFAIDKIRPFQPKASLFSPYLAALVLSEDGKALSVATQILAAEESYQSSAARPRVPTFACARSKFSAKRQTTGARLC